MPVVCRTCGGADLLPASLEWRQTYLGDTCDPGDTPAGRLRQTLVQAHLDAVRVTPCAVANGKPMD